MKNPETSNTEKTVVFAGGGTGGHLFPALAIAERLVDAGGGLRCVFACSQRPLDAEILKKETLNGVPVEFVPIRAQPFGVRPKALWRFVSNWGGSVAESRAVLQEASRRGPVVVVAMGGFVAAPMVQAARVEKVRTLMVNLDGVPGKSNRWAAKHVEQVLTAAAIDPSLGYGHWKQIPPIVRRAAVAPASAAECRKRLGLDPQRPVLLITGGSQGAGSINLFMRKFVEVHAEMMRAGGWQVLHQTGGVSRDGSDPVREMEVAYAAAGIEAVVRPFVQGFGEWWGAAELAMSRSGAGSVAEVWANGVPTVFLPYPYHKDQHQKKNAEGLVAAGAAVLVEDAVSVEANMRVLGPVVAGLMGDGGKRGEIREKLKGIGPANGAEQASEVVGGLFEGYKTKSE